MLSRTLVALAALALVGPPLLASAQSTSKPAAAKPSAMVNINTAAVTELQQLPGIGERTAARIVEYRQKNGPFKKIEETLENPRSCPCLLNISNLCALESVSRRR